MNAVAPGFVATGMHETTLASDRDDVGPYWEETERRLRDATPPEVAAELVAFLMSEAARRHQRPADQRRVGPVARRGRPGGPARADGLRAAAAHRRPALPRRRLMPLRAATGRVPSAPGLVAVTALRRPSPRPCCCPSSCWQNAWVEWGNALWLVERQAEIDPRARPPELLPAHGATPGPSTRSSSSTAARSSPSPACARHRRSGSAWAAFVAILALASACGAFGGMLWLGRQAGLEPRAREPCLRSSSLVSPYAVTILYGRGRLRPRSSRSPAIPLALAGLLLDRPGRTALERRRAARRRRSPPSPGSHNITLVWGVARLRESCVARRRLGRRAARGAARVTRRRRAPCACGAWSSASRSSPGPCVPAAALWARHPRLRRHAGLPSTPSRSSTGSTSSCAPSSTRPPSDRRRQPDEPLPGPRLRPRVGRGRDRRHAVARTGPRVDRRLAVGLSALLVGPRRLCWWPTRSGTYCPAS